MKNVTTKVKCDEEAWKEAWKETMGFIIFSRLPQTYSRLQINND